MNFLQEMSDMVCYSAGSLNTGQFWGGSWCELRPRNDVYYREVFAINIYAIKILYCSYVSHRKAFKNTRMSSTYLLMMLTHYTFVLSWNYPIYSDCVFDFASRIICNRGKLWSRSYHQ